MPQTKTLLHTPGTAFMNPSMGLLQHLHAATNQHQHQKLKRSKRAKKVYQSLVSSENSTQCVYSSFGKNEGRLLPHSEPATRGTSTVKIPVPGSLVISAGFDFPIKPLYCQGGLNALRYHKSIQLRELIFCDSINIVLWLQNTWRIEAS